MDLNTNAKFERFTETLHAKMNDFAQNVTAGLASGVSSNANGELLQRLEKGQTDILNKVVGVQTTFMKDVTARMEYIQVESDKKRISDLEKMQSALKE